MAKSNSNEAEKVNNSRNVKVEKQVENKKEVKSTKKETKNDTKKDEKNIKQTKNTSKVEKQETKKKIEAERLPNINKVAKNSILEISAEAKDNLNIQNNKENNAILKQDDEINNEKLEKIKDEIKKSKKDSKDKVKNSNLRKNLVRNLSIAIIVTIYFLFIDLGINSIPVTVYLLDLKTFAIFIAIISIIIFERAFKKDENYLAIHGIEMIALGIETLLLLQLYSAGNEYFNYILLAITLGMIAYYLIKCLCIYIRYKVKGK